MNQSMLGYISEHGHYDKFVALVVLLHQAHPHIDIGRHSDALANRFNHFVGSYPQGVYMPDDESLCGMFVELEQMRIYGKLFGLAQFGKIN